MCRMKQWKWRQRENNGLIKTYFVAFVISVWREFEVKKNLFLPKARPVQKLPNFDSIFDEAPAGFSQCGPDHGY